MALGSDMMMIRGPVDAIADGIKKIDGDRLVELIDHHIKMTRMGDQLMAGGNYAKRLTEGLSESLFRESDILLRNISLILTCYQELTIHFDQKQWAAQRSAARYGYFKKLKKHQVELLIQLTEDVEMIRTLITQTLFLSSMVYSHSRSLVKATQVDGTIAERIARRPMAIRNIQGVQTPAAGQSDASHANPGPDQHKEMPPCGSVAEQLFQSCYELIRETYDDVEHRGGALQANIKELRDGWLLFKRLIRGKLTRRIQKAMDTLIHQHNTRILLFQETVKAHRILQFPEEADSSAIQFN